ncbi:hypothetical protein TWF694_005759 [Orbilia ellipsospora]|uniref:Uncharacterized protein n=1 Tax=Orbilia ellipsospora TaxID=2528407 RepID=A0AAV9WSX2_9PEZI
MRIGSLYCRITRTTVPRYYLCSAQFSQHAGRICSRSLSLTDAYALRRQQNQLCHRQISTDAPSEPPVDHTKPRNLVRRVIQEKGLPASDEDVSIEEGKTQKRDRKESRTPPPIPWRSMIEGKTLHFPNLREVFKDWPCAENPHIEDITKNIKVRTTEKNRLAKPKQRLLLNSDIPSFVAKCYPAVTFDRSIDIVCRYTMWLFLWSHYINKIATNPPKNIDAINDYLVDCMDFAMLSFRIIPEDLVERSRGLQRDTLVPDNMTLFGKLGVSLNDIGLPARSSFSRVVCEYIRSVQTRMEMMALPGVPNVSSYMKAALPTVEIYPQLELYDYLIYKDNQYPKPSHMRKSKYIKYVNMMTKNLAEIALIIRDIYSVRTDVAAKSQFNMVVSSFFDGDRETPQSAEEVVDSLMELLRAKKIEFDAAVMKLSQETRLADQKRIGKISDKKAVTHEKHIDTLVKWCRYTITGYVDWNLKSNRYHLADSIQEDGSLKVTLE